MNDVLSNQPSVANRAPKLLEKLNTAVARAAACIHIPIEKSTPSTAGRTRDRRFCVASVGIGERRHVEIGKGNGPTSASKRDPPEVVV